MKVYKKEEFILAMKKVAKEYIDGTHKFKSKTCALCNVCEVDNGHNDSKCSICPWVIITGEKCHPVKEEKFLLRATELINWISKYEAAEEISAFKPFSVELKFKTFEEAEFWFSICGKAPCSLPGTEKIYNDIREKLGHNVRCIDGMTALARIHPGEKNWFEKYKELKKGK